MKPIGIFPGSFNPFTKGHLSVLERALPLFDKVIIAVGYNVAKTGNSDIEQRVRTIKKAVEELDNVEVTGYQGLTVDIAKACGASFIIRGVRDAADFEYERQMADINRQLTGIETLILYTLPQYASISSSMVRELRRYGVDVKQFLP